MNLFVLGIVAEAGRAEALQRSILDAHHATTPFAGMDHQAEVWQRGHVVAASFSIHADRLAIGGYSRATEHAFDTFAGLPRLASLAGGRDWGAALGEARDGNRFEPRDLGGVWALARATSDQVEVRTSSTGSIPLVLARRPGLVLLSNRATLARLAAWPDAPIAYDTDALSTLCSRGWLAHDRVPFSGLELLPPGVLVRAGLDGIHAEIAQRLAEPGEAPTGVASGGGRDGVASGAGRDGHDVGDVYDEMAAELLAAAKEVGGLGPRPRLELTGDPVTRLSAAVYAAAGVDAIAVTPHAQGDPHAVVAGEVARAIGFEHVCEPVEVAAGDVVDAATRQVFQGEGLSNVYDPAPPVRLDPVVEVVRHAGGSLLGGYDNLASGPRPPVESVEDARRFLDDLALHNYMLLLRDEAHTAQQQINRRTAEELLAEVGRLSFYELAWLRLREGRGTGANRQAAGYGAVQPAPMLDDRVLRHLQAIPLDHKRSHRAVFELVRRLQPSLATIRFVGRRWRFEDEGPSDLLDPQTWAVREPLPAAKADPGWRAATGRRPLPVVVERLGERDALLDEIIDRNALREALRGDEPLSDSDVRSLLGTLTARQLVSDAWLPDTRRGRRGSAAARTTAR
ncbi:MAG: hypothetical protein KG028_13020 [Actinobacteria bacterium]|nr:hypothetical protein [Actinomycetota bacterium]